MRILFKKSFLKQYQKLPKPYQSKVDHALRNHALSGRLAGKRSIAVGFDLRIIFEVQGEYVVVILLGVGTHNQVY